MRKRKLGSFGPEVSSLGLGCMGMSISYGPRDDKRSVATIHRALDLGVTFFDTADAYGNGHNETLIGSALNKAGAEVVIATKFGITRRDDGTRIISGHPDYVAKACEASLKRLSVDEIDLYYVHRIDPGIPIEDTVGAMSDLVKAGKIRHIGLSEAGAETIRRAHAVHPLAAVQSEYSLWTREPEIDILPLLDELEIGFVPYSPLGRGFLSGTLQNMDKLSADDRRRDLPRFQDTNLQKNLRLMASMKNIAKAHNATLAQIALAWLLARSERVIPIPGTKREALLKENCGAETIALSPDETGILEQAFPIGIAEGTRYPQATLQQLGI